MVRWLHGVMNVSALPPAFMFLYTKPCEPLESTCALLKFFQELEWRGLLSSFLNYTTSHCVQAPLTFAIYPVYKLEGRPVYAFIYVCLCFRRTPNSLCLSLGPPCGPSAFLSANMLPRKRMSVGSSRHFQFLGANNLSIYHLIYLSERGLALPSYRR